MCKFRSGQIFSGFNVAALFVKMHVQSESSLGLAGYLVGSMCMQGWLDIQLYLYINGFPM